MATHSSVLAWRIPGMGEPGGLPDVYGVAQSRTRLKRLSSSSNHSNNNSYHLVSTYCGAGTLLRLKLSMYYLL